MDGLSNSTIHALEEVIEVSVGLYNVKIEQDTDKEILVIKNELGQKTTMNCRINSVGATIRQVCSHINKNDLFSYEPDYVIGC